MHRKPPKARPARCAPTHRSGRGYDAGRVNPIINDGRPFCKPSSVNLSQVIDQCTAAIDDWTECGQLTRAAKVQRWRAALETMIPGGAQ